MSLAIAADDCNKTSSSSSSSSSSSGSTSSSSGSSGTSGSKKLGDDCTKGDECEGGKCLKFTGNDGKEHGFCTRQCTKAADCPESGWECNLSPYTACVPKK